MNEHNRSPAALLTPTGRRAARSRDIAEQNIVLLTALSRAGRYPRNSIAAHMSCTVLLETDLEMVRR